MVVMVTVTDFSQEIFAIDILKDLKFSLKHHGKHVLRWLLVMETSICSSLIGENLLKCAQRLLTKVHFFMLTYNHTLGIPSFLQQFLFKTKWHY